MHQYLEPFQPHKENLEVFSTYQGIKTFEFLFTRRLSICRLKRLPILKVYSYTTERMETLAGNWGA